ncbi:helix-turn-helix domain-containing protein [Paenibacillus chungangensis]|uniref:Helix-turn-helix domain-containing protein n=1 Tax=Paenibacillus chungangensis TaxID=696535 RepID=A0ABW3HUP1_9BACL
MRNSSYLKKLVLFSLLLGAIPILVLGVYSHSQASKTIRQNAEVGSGQLLLQSKLKVEQNLKNIDTTLTSFLHSTFVDKALNEPYSPERFDLFDQLGKSMYRLQIFEVNVENILLFNLKQQWSISNDGVQVFEDNSLLDEELQVLKDPGVNTLWLHQAGGHLLLVKKYPLHVSNPDAVLVARISGAEVERILMGETATSGLAILGSNGELIAGSNPIDQGESIARLYQTSVDQQMNTGFRMIKADGEEYGVSYIHSEYNGWIYANTYSISALTVNMVSIAMFTIFLCLLILCVIAVVSFMGFYKMHSPIRKIVQLLSGQLKGTAGNKNDEVQYIRDQVFHMIEERTRLNDENQIQVQHLEEFFIHKLIHGNVSEKEMIDKSEQYKFPSNWRQYCILVIQIDALGETRYSELDAELLLFAIGNMAAELISPARRLRPIGTGESLVVIYGTVEDDYPSFKKEIYQTTEHLQNTVRRYLELAISIGVSRPFIDLKDCPRAYTQGVDALKYRIGLGGNAILFMDEVLPEQFEEWFYPKHLELELMEAIKLFDENRVEEILHVLIQELLGENLNHLEYPLSLARLMLELLRLLQDTGISHQALYTEEKTLFEHLFRLKTSMEIEEWFKDKVIWPIISLMKDNRHNHHRQIANELFKCIQEKYNTNLTLEQCAAELNYHPDYAGRIFRDQVGISFSECLQKHRLTVAKTWLKETDMKINDMAQHLCYASSANFIRYFRKSENMTPGQYRESMRHTKKEQVNE